MRHLVLIMSAGLLLAACAGGQAQPTPGGPTDGEAQTVSIFDFGYDPATLSVSMGQPVEWTNDGDVPHTVTFDDGQDSGTLNVGGTFEHTFDAAGEFAYTCTIHPAMTGVVNVSP